MQSLVEGEDYYINDQGLWVFTEAYHIKRGYCCGSGCRHCPYGFRTKSEITSDSMMLSKDQMGNEWTIPFPPKKIISLVPSQTELLFDLGLDNEIIGITKFCIRPEEKTKAIEKIGGTKKFNLEKIMALKPDLIIGNKEENYPEGIQTLQQNCTVWMSDIYTFEDAISMIREVSRITNRVEVGQAMAEEIMKRFNAYKPMQGNLRVAYLIWQDPYMVAARETFIDEMLRRFGLTNAFAHLTRYPVVSLEMMIEAKPDLIFLSSEPFPFKEKHILDFTELLPSSKALIVDGQYFSWYGSRLLETPGYFSSLQLLCKY